MSFAIGLGIGLVVGVVIGILVIRFLLTAGFPS